MTPAQPPAIVQTVIQPGADSQAHTNNMQAKLATALNDVYKLDVQPQHLQPVSQQSPVTPELAHVMSKPHSERDFEDTMAGWKGKPRTEASKNFLKVFMNRLQKKNPNHDIQEAG